MLTAEAQEPGAGSVYAPRTAVVLKVKALTALEMLFELEPGAGAALHHIPGQFVQVSIPCVGECPISICSSPTRLAGGRFELCVRRVGEVTSAIHRLSPGDEVGIRGPFGRGFDMNALAGHDVIIVAGGCALAPARSVIQYILDRRDRFGAFHLLYGARSPEELLFRDELAEWGSDSRIECLVTVDRGDAAWRGHTGVVTRLFPHVPPMDNANTRAVVIGPPVMFKFVMLELLGRGIAQEHIYFSLERRMKCGIGKCGHCQVNHLYACLDGPVFNYGEIFGVHEAIA